MKTKIAGIVAGALVLGLSVVGCGEPETVASPAAQTPTAVGFMGARQDDSGYSFFVFDIGSGNQMKLAPALALPSADVWSPDRKTLAYLDMPPYSGNASGSSFSLIGVDGQDQREVADLGKLVPMPWSWSPDAKEIVMLCFTGGQAEPRADGTIDERHYLDVFSLDLATGQTKRLTDSKDLGKSSPIYSPDGKKISFIGVEHDPETWEIKSYGIYAINPDGSGLTRLLGTSFAIRSFQWSPGGKKIVYSAYDEKKGLNSAEIYVNDLEGPPYTTVARLTNSPDADDVDPVWSPDGKKIAFCSGVVRQGYHISVMNADGSGAVDLYDLPDYPMGFASWSPDGKSILFTDRQVVYSIGADGKDLKVILDGKNTYRDIMYPVWLVK